MTPLHAKARPVSAFEGTRSNGTQVSTLPYQYSTTGFAHFQQSGTGAVGNYMNYLKVMPLRISAAGRIPP